jgi:hypothetical protein
MNKLYPWTVDTERVRLTYCLGHWHAGPSASVIILINSPFFSSSLIGSIDR